MDDKSLALLTTLAEKLGTTAEYLWSVLLKQALISGVLDLIVLAAWVAGSVYLVRLVYRKTVGEGPQWKEEFVKILAWVGVALVCMTTAMSAGTTIPAVVTAFVNPEYWALLQILK